MQANWHMFPEHCLWTQRLLNSLERLHDKWNLQLIFVLVASRLKSVKFCNRIITMMLCQCWPCRALIKKLNYFFLNRKNATRNKILYSPPVTPTIAFIVVVPHRMYVDISGNRGNIKISIPIAKSFKKSALKRHFFESISNSDLNFFFLTKKWKI